MRCFMKYYIVDAFTDELFKGNPAGVCVLDKALDDKTMQSIAAENNLSETAFIKKNNNGYDLKWFTPETEIDLCGHATLAAAYVINNFIDKKAVEIAFNTLSGELKVVKNDKMYDVNLPASNIKKVEVHPLMEKAIGTFVVEAYAARDLMLRLESEEQLKKLKPNTDLLKETGYLGIIATTKGSEADFVSRFFAPNAGIAEDPVTGSSHCMLIPYWSEKLHKTYMVSKQLSSRGGTVYCRYLGNNVLISGNAVLYLEGNINI